jgi:putative ATPase
MAINDAQALVSKTGDLPVPFHLRNAPTSLMKDLGFGKEYKYAHEYDDHFIEENYLPEGISNTRLYKPQDNPHEEKFLARLRKLWSKRYGY